MEEIKIEVLFPEFCNLYGDIFNIKYLQKCLPDAKFFHTSFDEEPKFLKEKVNLIYLGPMTENMQEKVIKKLLPYKERIQELMQDDVPMLFTGNSMEILGKYIENEDGSKIEGLGILDIYAKRDMMNRFNCLFLGKYEDMEIVGFKSQFTMCYGNNENTYFAEVEKGIGLNKESKLEGIKYHEFIGTYILRTNFSIKSIIYKKHIKENGNRKPKTCNRRRCYKCILSKTGRI